jgi:hypothetical protein
MYRGDRQDPANPNSKPDGMGVKEWANGQKYEGGWKQGLMHGVGVMTFPDGGRYEGQFFDDIECGFGVRTYAIEDGRRISDKYEGDWKDGKKHGEVNACFNELLRL